MPLTTRRICLDSSVLFKLVLPEPQAPAADALLASAVKAAVLVVAPAFAWAEVGSGIRRRVRQGLLTGTEADAAWLDFRGLPVVFLAGEDTADRAWALAQRWHLPTLYDAAFLAAGEGAGYWTADEDLLRALAPDTPPWAHRLGHPFVAPA